MDIISLLLHVVGDIDFWHENFLSTSNLELFISLLLSNLSHLLHGTIVKLSLFLHVISLALLQEMLLLHATISKKGFKLDQDDDVRSPKLTLDLPFR